MERFVPEPGQIIEQNVFFHPPDRPTDGTVFVLPEAQAGENDMSLTTEIGHTVLTMDSAPDVEVAN